MRHRPIAGCVDLVKVRVHWSARGGSTLHPGNPARRGTDRAANCPGGDGARCRGLLRKHSLLHWRVRRGHDRAGAPAPQAPPAPGTPPAQRALRAAPAPTGRSTTRTRRGPASPPACRPPGRSRTAWSAQLDGAVYGQPLVVGSEVIAATENDSIYALSRTTGKTIWRTNVGTPVPQSALNGCGNIFPLGITGTPIYDAGNGLVYAVAEITGYHHVLVALDAATGALKQQRDLDSPTGAKPARLQPAAPRAGDRRRAGLRHVRRAVRRLRRLPGERRQRAAQWQRAAHQLAHPDQRGKAPSGPPADRSSGPTATCGSPSGTARPSPAPVRRQRLGHRAQPGPAAARLLRAEHLGGGQRGRPRPRLDPAGPGRGQHGVHRGQARRRLPAEQPRNSAGSAASSPSRASATPSARPR